MDYITIDEQIIWTNEQLTFDRTSFNTFDKRFKLNRKL